MEPENVNCKHEGCGKEMPTQDALDYSNQEDLFKCKHCGWINKWEYQDGKVVVIEARPGWTAWDLPEPSNG